jgi:TolB-like protein
MVIIFAFAGGLLAEQAPAATQSEGASTASQQKPYDPPNTKVALIPFANGAGGSVDQADACQGGTQRIREAFASRGFQVLDDKAVAEAVKKAHVDFADPEDRKKEKFQEVGEALEADLVVSGLLLYFKTDRTRPFVRIELKVYDTRDKVYRVRAVQAGTTKVRGLFANAQDFRRRALGNAIDEALKDFLKPYPVTKKQEQAASSG